MGRVRTPRAVQFRTRNGNEGLVFFHSLPQNTKCSSPLVTNGKREWKLCNTAYTTDHRIGWSRLPFLFFYTGIIFHSAISNQFHKSSVIPNLFNIFPFLYGPASCQKRKIFTDFPASCQFTLSCQNRKFFPTPLQAVKYW